MELPSKVFPFHVYTLFLKIFILRNEPEKAQNWPPSQYDFSGLDNVVMSPHRGGGLHTPEVEEQRYVDLEEIMQEIRKNGWESIKSHQNIYHSSLGY